MYRIGKSVKTESRLVVAGDWGNGRWEEANRYGSLFGMMKKFWKY